MCHFLMPQGIGHLVLRKQKHLRTKTLGVQSISLLHLYVNRFKQVNTISKEAFCDVVIDAMQCLIDTKSCTPVE